MLTFLEFIQLAEARRNPDMNPKVSAYEALKQYADDPDIYITFTHDFSFTPSNSDRKKIINGRKQSMPNQTKVGLNPKSEYGTPLGIFCYPLETVWDYYDIDRYRTLNKLPFAMDRPHIYVLRAKGVGTTFINDMYVDYGSNKYDKDIEILEKIWNQESSKIKNIWISYDHEANLSKAQERIWRCESIVETLLITPGKDFRTTPKEEMVTKWKKALEIAQQEMQDLKDYEKKYIKNYWETLVRKSLDTAKEKNAVMSFWNLTRLMSLMLADDSHGIRAITKWNWLLRKCGYSGFADKTGRGYIHQAEPIQAVFLSRDAFEVVTKVDNKDYINYNIRTMEQLLELCGTIQLDISTIADKLAYGYGFNNREKVEKYTITVDEKTLFKSATSEDIKEIFTMMYKYCKLHSVDQEIVNMSQLIYEKFYEYGMESEFKPSVVWYNKIQELKD